MYLSKHIAKQVSSLLLSETDGLVTHFSKHFADTVDTSSCVCCCAICILAWFKACSCISGVTSILFGLLVRLKGYRAIICNGRTRPTVRRQGLRGRHEEEEFMAVICW